MIASEVVRYCYRMSYIDSLADLAILVEHADMWWRDAGDRASPWVMRRRTSSRDIGETRTRYGMENVRPRTRSLTARATAM